MSNSDSYFVFKNGSPESVVGLENLNAILADKSDATLRVEAALLNTNPSGQTRNAASMSQMELDRRAAEEADTRARNLAIRTTRETAIYTVGAAIAGALVGAWLTS